MSKAIKHHTYLIEDYLKDSERAKNYLREAVLEGDLELLKAVVEDLIDAGYKEIQVSLSQSSNLENVQSFADIEIVEVKNSNKSNDFEKVQRFADVKIVEIESSINEIK